MPLTLFLPVSGASLASGNVLARVVCPVGSRHGPLTLELNHHHWTTPQGVRFTVSPEAKDELLDRSLELNHERYAAEVAAGLHDKKARKIGARRSPKSAPNQEKLL